MTNRTDDDPKLPPDENPHQGVGFKFGKDKELDDERKREQARLLEEQKRGRSSAADG